MSGAPVTNQDDLHPFTPPKWCKGLKNVPNKRFKLSQRPTPIHEWDLPLVKNGFEVCVKRDDMAGSAATGNKVRKMDFLLAEAVDRGCDCVITCGKVQSNHVRTTAVTAKEIGLECHLVLSPPITNTPIDLKPEDAPVRGNLLLCRLAGAHVYLETKYEGNRFVALNRMMNALADKLRSQNKKPYIIDLGGAGVTGLWAYIEAFQEMIDQGVLDNFDDIFVPVSTGGTACGIAVGNYLNGSKIKVHAVVAFNNAQMMYDKMNEELRDLGLVDENGQPVRAEELVNVIDGYSEAVNEKDKAMLCDISSSTGVILDTAFTLKMMKCLLFQVENNPTIFRGRRILFIHTGGLFGVADGGSDNVIMENSKKIISISDICQI